MITLILFTLSAMCVVIWTYVAFLVLGAPLVWLHKKYRYLVELGKKR